MQKIIYLDEIEDYENLLNKKIIDYIKEDETETFESFKNYDLIAFNWYDRENINCAPEKIIIYLDSKNLVFICEGNTSYELVESLVKTSRSNETTLREFFESILKGSFQHLEELEDKVTEIDDNIMKGIKNDTRRRIVRARYEILRLKKYYEQFDIIFDSLIDNENGLLGEDSIKCFEVLRNRSLKIEDMVLNLKEYIIQIRESYQAQIALEQNDLMRFFTIVTSIFMPLTLITGWYGMNLKMPEFAWKYGYLFVIGLTIFVGVIWFYIFKKKKWM